MSSLFKGTKWIVLALSGLLVIGSVATFAQHNVALAKILAGPVNAAALAAQEPTVQEGTTKRPLVRIFLTGAIERDSKEIPVEKAGSVSPGEIVSFTLNSVNEGGAPAREYHAVGQIPQGATFVGGSALGDRDTQVSYSIDQGGEFSPKPMIDEKQPDGTIKKVVAPVSMYTQVRFEWADPLAAGGKVVASYQVRVK